MTIKKTLTLTELAEYLGWNKRTLYRKVKSGDFPVEPLKGITPRQWSKESIDSWMESAA